nr:hypothetical protein [Flavobacterium sp.]
MKKLIMLSAISIITLSSFGIKKSHNHELNKKDIKEMQYYWHCKNGNASGSVICDCTVSEVISMVSFWC